MRQVQFKAPQVVQAIDSPESQWAPRWGGVGDCCGGKFQLGPSFVNISSWPRDRNSIVNLPSPWPCVPPWRKIMSRLFRGYVIGHLRIFDLNWCARAGPAEMTRVQRLAAPRAQSLIPLFIYPQNAPLLWFILCVLQMTGLVMPCIHEIVPVSQSFWYSILHSDSIAFDTDDATIFWAPPTHLLRHCFTNLAPFVTFSPCSFWLSVPTAIAT